jgi:hypothetical protein
MLYGTKHLKAYFFFIFLVIKLLRVGATDNGIEGCHSGIEVSVFFYYMWGNDVKCQ